MMDEKKSNNSITKNKYKKNYQDFESMRFYARQRGYKQVAPHWHNFFELELIIGKGCLTLDDSEYQFEHGIFSFTTPSSIHSYELDDASFQSFCFNFDINHLESKKLSAYISQSSSMTFLPNEAEIKFYTEILNSCSEESNRNNLFSQLYCLKVLEFLIMDIHKKANEKYTYLQENPISSIQDAIVFIKKNYREDIHLNNIASKVFLTPKYFSHLFKKETGQNFSKYLNEIRLKNACHMLKQSNDPVIEIAEDSGFKNSKHFHRMFKKQYGMTPLEYRNNKSNK